MTDWVGRAYDRYADSLYRYGVMILDDTLKRRPTRCIASSSDRSVGVAPTSNGWSSAIDKLWVTL
jgi:hypothetical protein